MSRQKKVRKFDYSFHKGKIVYAFQMYTHSVQKLN